MKYFIHNAVLCLNKSCAHNDKKKGYLINFRGVNGQSSRKHVFKKQQALYEKYAEANEFGELCTLQMSKYLISDCKALIHPNGISCAEMH